MSTNSSEHLNVFPLTNSKTEMKSVSFHPHYRYSDQMRMDEIWNRVAGVERGHMVMLAMNTKTHDSRNSTL